MGCQARARPAATSESPRAPQITTEPHGSAHPCPPCLYHVPAWDEEPPQECPAALAWVPHPQVLPWAQTPGPRVTLKVNPEPSTFTLLLDSQLSLGHHPPCAAWLPGTPRHASEVEWGVTKVQMPCPWSPHPPCPVRQLAQLNFEPLIKWWRCQEGSRGAGGVWRCRPHGCEEATPSCGTPAPHQGHCTGCSP